MEPDRLSFELAQKQDAARMTAEALSLDAGLARDTVGRWIRGTTVPTLAALQRVEGVLSGRLGYPVDLSAAVQERRSVRQRRRSPTKSVGDSKRQVPPLLRSLAELDPFDLEVHRSIEAEVYVQLPALPRYVPRDHDVQLRRVVREAAEGSSRLAVLVGGSLTGKTRACWEALEILRQRDRGWQLWHPIDPTRPNALLAGIGSIGSRTVVWLNEAQSYLETPDETGENVAAGLRELLRDRIRAPVLVLATLWPAHWDALTMRAVPDRHAQARELLSGRNFDVPERFTPSASADLMQAASADPRLAEAAARAADGRVTQYLSGGPLLLDRYRQAFPAARALIDVAMDARRIGCASTLPLVFLADAAPGYLTDREWDQQDENWLSHALAYTTRMCNGVPGPLTRVRLRDAGIASPPRSRDEAVSYRLADYLDQYGRQERLALIPPSAFWTAAAHAAPVDRPALARAAQDRGELRAAAQIWKYATASDARATLALVRLMHECTPDDERPSLWALARAPLDDAADVIALLDGLRTVGAREPVAALLARNPAAQVALKAPRAVVNLLYCLKQVGGEDQAAVLAGRAAAGLPLHDSGAVASLLNTLRQARAEAQVTILLARNPAARASLDDQSAVSMLLDELRAAGAVEQVAALAGRAVAAVPIHHPAAVGFLIDRLQAVGADEQVKALLGRNPAIHAAVSNPDAIPWLMRSLRAVGAQEQVTTLAERAAAHAPLDDPPGAFARLLYDLRDIDADEQAAALIERAARIPLDDPCAVAITLESLRQAGAHKQFTALLARNPAAHVAIDDPYAVAFLLGTLVLTGMYERVTAMVARHPAHAALDELFAVPLLLNRLRQGGADEQATGIPPHPAVEAVLADPEAVAFLMAPLPEPGADEQVTALLARNPAAHVAIGDPGHVADLLDSLRYAGAEQDAIALAERAAVHVSLDDPYSAASLLDSLQETGRREQVATLLARNPAAHTDLTNPHTVAGLLDSLRQVGAHEQAAALADRAAAHATLSAPDSVAQLLENLQDAGASKQAALLISRLPAEGLFELFCKQGNNQVIYRFGRQPNGMPAPHWDWDNLK